MTNSKYILSIWILISVIAPYSGAEDLKEINIPVVIKISSSEPWITRDTFEDSIFPESEQCLNEAFLNLEVDAKFKFNILEFKILDENEESGISDNIDFILLTRRWT